MKFYAHSFFAVANCCIILFSSIQAQSIDDRLQDEAKVAITKRFGSTIKVESLSLQQDEVEKEVVNYKAILSTSEDLYRQLEFPAIPNTIISAISKSAPPTPPNILSIANLRGEAISAEGAIMIKSSRVVGTLPSVRLSKPILKPISSYGSTCVVMGTPEAEISINNYKKQLHEYWEQAQSILRQSSGSSGANATNSTLINIPDNVKEQAAIIKFRNITKAGSTYIGTMMVTKESTTEDVYFIFSEDRGDNLLGTTVKWEGETSKCTILNLSKSTTDVYRARFVFDKNLPDGAVEMALERITSYSTRGFMSFTLSPIITNELSGEGTMSYMNDAKVSLISNISLKLVKVPLSQK